MLIESATWNALKPALHKSYRTFFIFTLILFLFFFSCTFSGRQYKKLSDKDIKLVDFPVFLETGQVYFPKIYLNTEVSNIFVSFNDTQLSVIKLKKTSSSYAFILPVDIYIEEANYELVIEGDSGNSDFFKYSIFLPVKYKERGIEKLSVDPGKVVYSDFIKKRIKSEYEQKKDIIEQNLNVRFWENNIFCPAKTCHVTSNFGQERVFNDLPRGIHTGVDLRASNGEPLYAPMAARVDFVINYFLSGKGVILDHGMGIFSVFGHMSEVFVKEGQIVNIGQKVGLAGSTGRVTGPHLHWELYINSMCVDPMSLMNLFNNYKQ